MNGERPSTPSDGQEQPADATPERDGQPTPPPLSEPDAGPPPNIAEAQTSQPLPRPLGDVEPIAAHLDIRADRWAHRRAEPRALAAFWLFFLVGATLLTVGAAGVVGLIATDVYRPSVRVLLVITSIGIGVVWPMIRLSQELPRSIVPAVLADAFVILAPAIAMIAPQSLRWMAAWTPDTVTAMSITTAAWGLLAAALIALAQHSIRAEEPDQPPRRPSIARTWWMAAILILTCGGAFAALFDLADHDDDTSGRFLWMLSLPTALWELSSDRSPSGFATEVLPNHRAAIIGVVGAAAITWVFVALGKVTGPKTADADEQ